MKIKQIAKSVIRGFTLSAVMTSMTVNTFAASSSITDAKPLIIATYGIFNEDSNSAENVLNANPGTTDSIDFDSTMQEEFSPRNFTANQTGNAQLFTSASWENEANGTAKIETTFKIDDLNSKSGERAVYISATCTSHGNNLFLTAENITKLCQNYKHVDVIMVGPRRTTDISEKMIKGTWNCFTKSDPAGVFGVVYDIQDKINEDSTERYTYDGKTYDIARGFLKKDHSGYSSIVKTQNTINNGKGVLFRDRKSVVKNISTANRFLTFTGDRHAQGYEYIAISAYLNNKWGFGSRSLNDISCMYVYVDTGGWMGGDSDAYEQTGNPDPGQSGTDRQRALQGFGAPHRRGALRQLPRGADRRVSAAMSGTELRQMRPLPRGPEQDERAHRQDPGRKGHGGRSGHHRVFRKIHCGYRGLRHRP